MTHFASVGAAPEPVEPADLARRFPAFDARRAAVAFVSEPDGGIAFAAEPFDSAALDLRIGRVLFASAATLDAYEQLLLEVIRHARRDRFDQVLRRTALANLPEIWALERCGFELMDVGITFARHMTGSLAPGVHADLEIRASTDEDIDEIVRLMLREPWNSRYESDPCYDPAQVRELRSQWLWNSHRGRADIVLVGLIDGRPAGYVTCRVDPATRTGEIELVGTLPGFRGRHVASRVLAEAVAWFSTRTTLVTVRTQATNIAAARLYECGGFTLHSSDMTFRLAMTRRERESA